MTARTCVVCLVPVASDPARGIHGGCAPYLAARGWKPPPPVDEEDGWTRDVAPEEPHVDAHR